MREREFFTRPVTIDITSATIGINRLDWYCYKQGMTQEEVRQTMILRKYDIAPIQNKQGQFTQYFTLEKPDNLKLRSNKIEPGDRLYYLTHIRDAVWKMNKAKKDHYFLSNGHDEDDIVGLLSLSNFNCREFYVFIFSLISYVEREFAMLIEADESKGFKVLDKLSHTEALKAQLEMIKSRFKGSENENDYKEYLYLHHLIWLVKEERKFEKLNYKSGDEFEMGTKVLKEIRNNIAHPVRSLVRNMDDLNSLDIGLNKLYEYKDRLDIYLSSKESISIN